MERKERVVQPKDPVPAADGPTSEASGEAVQGTSRPLLMVDIDGVISLFSGQRAHHGWGHGRPSGSSLHSIDGIPHFLSATAARHLLQLSEHFDLVWASGWEEKADEHLPRLLGLPQGLPFLRFERSVGRANAHWKLQAIEAFAAGRPLAWLDDALDSACHDWARARAAATLLVQTDPTKGLTEREAASLTAWARELRGSAAQPA
jgi:hypothetical protein